MEHSCKYSEQGCEVKMMLKDLLVHERSCSERTVAVEVVCPHNDSTLSQIIIMGIVFYVLAFFCFLGASLLAR